MPKQMPSLDALHRIEAAKVAAGNLIDFTRSHLREWDGADQVTELGRRFVSAIVDLEASIAIEETRRLHGEKPQ